MAAHYPNLVQPRWFPLLAAFFTCLLMLTAGEKYLQQLLLESFSLQQQYVDEPSYISHVSHHYKPENKATIILLGGSVTREISLPDIEMENKGLKILGEEIDFINLGSSDQSLFESLALLSTLDIPKNAIIVQQFSYKKLDSGLSTLRKEYLSPRTTYLNYSLLEYFLPLSDKLERMIKPDLLLYAVPIRNYLSKRGCGLKLLMTLSGRKICYKDKMINRTYYANRQPLSLAEKSIYVRNIQRQVIPNYLEHHKISLKILKKISILAKQNGAHLIFAIYPFDKMEDEMYSSITSTNLYKDILSQAKKIGRILNFEKNTLLNHNDFYDTQHLTKSGKLKFSDILLNSLDTITAGTTHD